MITFDRKLYNRVLTIPTHRTWRLPTSSASRVRRCSLGTTPGWINHIKTCGFCTCTLTYICAGTGTVKEAFIRPKFMNHCCFVFFSPQVCLTLHQIHTTDHFQLHFTYWWQFKLKGGTNTLCFFDNILGPLITSTQISFILWWNISFRCWWAWSHPGWHDPTPIHRSPDLNPILTLRGDFRAKCYSTFKLTSVACTTVCLL